MSDTVHVGDRMGYTACAARTPGQAQANVEKHPDHWRLVTCRACLLHRDDPVPNRAGIFTVDARSRAAIDKTERREDFLRSSGLTQIPCSCPADYLERTNGHAHLPGCPAPDLTR